MKTRKSRAYIFYGVILLLIFSIIIILRTSVVENLFKGSIERFIKSKTGINVSIGKISISILSSSVTLSSLMLKSDSSYKVDIGKLTVVFEPPSILKKKPQLKTVYINNADISVFLNTTTFGKMHGSTSTPDITKLETRLPVDIKHIVLNNVSLTVSMATSNSKLEAKNISMSLYPDFSNRRFSGVVDIKGLSVSHDNNVIIFSDVQYSGLIKDEDIFINSLRISSSFFECVMSGNVNNYNNPYLNLHLKASAKNVQQLKGFLKTMPISLPEISGSYEFDGNIKGSIFNPSSSGNIVFNDMKIGKIQGGTGNLSYTFKSRKLYIKKANVSIANGTVDFNGSVDFSKTNLPATFSLNLNKVSFGELLYSLGVHDPYVDAFITGQVEVKGRFNPVYFSGDLNMGFNRFAVYDDFFKSKKRDTIMIVKPVNIRSGLILTNQCAYITGTTVSSALSTLYADTALYFTGAMFLKFDSNKLNMQDVSPIASIPYTGIGSVKGYIAGPFNNIVIHGDVSFNNYSMEHIELGNVNGGITFSSNVLSLESVKAVKGDSRMYVNGGIQFTKDIELHMNARMEPVALKEFADNIGYNFTTGGYITGDVNIDGPIKEMSGNANLYFSQPDLYYQSFDKGTISIKMHKGIFDINNALFEKNSDQIFINGFISENGDMDLHFYTNKFDISNMDTITRIEPSLKAVLTFTGDATGNVKSPIATAVIKMKNIAYNDVSIPQVNALMNFSDGTFTSNVEMFEDTLDLKAEVETTVGYPFRLRTNFKNFDAHCILSLFYGVNFTSDVNGTLWLTGKIKDVPNSLVGYIYLDKVSLVKNLAILENNKPLFMDIAKDNVYFRDFEFRGKNSFIELKGFFNLKGNVDTLINANIDLSYLPIFTNVLIGSSGTLRLNSRIYGERGNISINGNAELNGDATFSEEPVSVSGLHISVLMTNDNIIIKEITGYMNAGAISGGGRIVMTDLIPKLFDVSLNLKGVNFVYNNTIPIQLNGNLNLEGTYPQPVLEGDIKIINATYTDYINWEDEILKFQKRRYEPEIIEQKRGHPLKLNINIESERSIVIDNNIVNTILSAELKLIGDIDNPIIVGNISTNEGQIYYRSTVFNIDNAVVTYTREHPQQPFIDIRASTNQQFMVNNEYTDYKIYLTIAGELDKLNISLTSYPPNLDEMDIISLLTYGVTPSDLMKSGMGSAAAYEVGSAVGSKLAKDIFSEVVGKEDLNTFRKYFWIDNIQIEPYYPIGAPSTSVRLTITKRFTNNFNILYSYDLSGYNLQRFQGEYRLGKGLYFIGSWNNGITTIQSNSSSNSIGNFGGDLKYKIEF